MNTFEANSIFSRAMNMYLKYIALIINYTSILSKKYQMYLCIIWMSAPIEIAYHINLFLGSFIKV